MVTYAFNPELRRQRQDLYEFEASLICIVSPKSTKRDLE